jgi:hypothetical protein
LIANFPFLFGSNKVFSTFLFFNRRYPKVESRTAAAAFSEIGILRIFIRLRLNVFFAFADEFQTKQKNPLQKQINLLMVANSLK